MPVPMSLMFFTRSKSKQGPTFSYQGYIKDERSMCVFLKAMAKVCYQTLLFGMDHEFGVTVVMFGAGTVSPHCSDGRPSPKLEKVGSEKAS